MSMTLPVTMVTIDVRLIILRGGGWHKCLGLPRQIPSSYFVLYYIVHPGTDLLCPRSN